VGQPRPIVTGAGFYTLAILGSIVIGLVLFIFIKESTFDTPYLLVINCDDGSSEQNLYQNLNRLVKRLKRQAIMSKGTLPNQNASEPRQRRFGPFLEIDEKSPLHGRTRQCLDPIGTTIRKVKLRYSTSASLPAHKGNGG